MDVYKGQRRRAVIVNHAVSIGCITVTRDIPASTFHVKQA